jgi:hypothetical protein
MVRSTIRPWRLWSLVEEQVSLDIKAIREHAESALESGDESHPMQVIALCDAYEKQHSLLKVALCKLGDDLSQSDREYWEQFIRGEAGIT